MENKLERECGQIYSPIKNHPFFQQQKETTQSKPSPQRQPIVPEHKSSQPKQTTAQPFTITPNLQSLPNPSSGPPQLPIMKECNIEKFAQDNLNLKGELETTNTECNTIEWLVFAGGLFRKKTSLRDMLSWTSDTIGRPMLAVSRDKVGKKLAIEMFKLVQIYMGDRKARDGMSLNSVAMDIINTALAQPHLRDELYIQLCRQTTENHIRESLLRGWELLTICLSFLPPSPTFQPALLK